MEIIKQYLAQPSTYRGVALLFGILGITFDPEDLERIGTGIIGSIALYETIKNRP